MKKFNPYHLSLFFVSASLLSLEISLMRVLKVEGFGNFTYTAIALALTGFGASGTLVCLFRKRILKKEYQISLFSVVMFIFSLGLGYFLSKEITFDPLRVVWDKNQILRLLLRYLFYTIPFIFGSAFIVLAFTVERAGRAYFYNLLGSGFGVFIILLSLYLIPPNRIMIVSLLLAFLSVISVSFTIKLNYKMVLCTIILIFSGYLLFFMSDINILPYKGIKLALNLPDAEVIEKRLSPFGTIEVVKSSKIRIAHGLSLSFEGKLPDQHGLFIDGDMLSAVDRTVNDESLDYLYYQTQSAVYKLHRRPRVFIIGLGGGTAVERAFRNHARIITSAEENPGLPYLLKNSFRNYNNNFFNKNSIVIIENNGRNYLASQPQKFWDIIEISETDTAVSSIGGIYSTDTNYTLTREAFEEYLKHISENGTISVTILLKYPPRKLLKLVALSKYALEKQGIDPDKRILIIRSWSTATLMTKKIPFTEEEIKNIKSFCRSMFFDLVYYPGIKTDEVNQFNVVEDAIYYRSILQILTDYDSFKKNYLFNIKYPTDDKPYFSYFFRLKKIPVLFKEMGTKWFPIIEGGYIVLFSTFITTIVLSTIFIVFPLFFTGKRIGEKKYRILFYFSLIAISYMFIEITLMQRLNRYLANPIYSNSVILAALLIFSGIGSYLSDYFSMKKGRLLLYAVAFISVYFILFLFLSEILYLKVLKPSLLLKLLISLLVISPMGIAMGIPFPLAIANLKKRDDHSLPWAWSINGYFSVIASTGIVIVSLNIGLLVTGIIAILSYIIALMFFPK